MLTMDALDGIQDHMEVVDSRGMHVGTVDAVDGDRIRLTKDDSPDNMHHVISRSLVASVDQKVHLAKSRDDVFRLWQDE